MRHVVHCNHSHFVPPVVGVYTYMYIPQLFPIWHFPVLCTFNIFPICFIFFQKFLLSAAASRFPNFLPICHFSVLFTFNICEFFSFSRLAAAASLFPNFFQLGIFQFFVHLMFFQFCFQFPDLRPPQIDF